MNLNKLNVVVRSFAKVNGLDIPIKVDIADIKETTRTCEYIYNIDINFDNREAVEYVVDKTESPFQRYYDDLEINNKIRDIYKFIDKDICGAETGKTFLELLSINGEEDFINFFLYSGYFDTNSLNKLSEHISFIIKKTQKIFSNNAIELFELNKDFPIINLKDDAKYAIDKNKQKCLSYNFDMLTLQTGAEYPMAIWFKENENKALMEWSWREQEAKRIYLTAKSKIDNYAEKVKNEVMESIQNPEANTSNKLKNYK